MADDQPTDPQPEPDGPTPIEVVEADPARVRRTNKKLFTALAAGLVVMIAGVVALVVFQGRAAAGTVYSDGWVGGETQQARVRVPSGPIRLSLTSGDTMYRNAGDEPRPPLGGAFIQVKWDADLRTDRLIHSVPLAGNRRVTLTLVAGGSRIPLPATIVAGSTYGSVVVAVDDGDDAAVEVTFEGQTQRVTVATGAIDAGAAQPLYDAPRTRLTCDPQTSKQDDVLREWTINCNAPIALLVPYVDGLGWAPEGSQWLVSAGGYFQFLGNPEWLMTRDKRADYELEQNATGTITVNGERPRKTLPHVNNGRAGPELVGFGTQIFAIPATGKVTLTMQATFTATFRHADDGVTGYPPSVKVPVSVDFSVG